MVQYVLHGEGRTKEYHTGFSYVLSKYFLGFPYFVFSEQTFVFKN